MKSSKTKKHQTKRTNENWAIAVPSCDASPLIWLPSVPWPLAHSQLSWQRISVPKLRMAQQWMPLKRGPHLRNAPEHSGYELRAKDDKETIWNKNDPQWPAQHPTIWSIVWAWMRYWAEHWPNHWIWLVWCPLCQCQAQGLFQNISQQHIT